MIGERGFRLSGGEKQRLAIARLLLKDPDVVILDEATAHLDNESERALLAALGPWLADRVAIVVAHPRTTVVGADRIVVLVGGQVVESGTHAQLLGARGAYARLHQELTTEENTPG